MPSDYSAQQKAQAQAAALEAGSLERARTLLRDAWDTRRVPVKDTLARWLKDPAIEPDTAWMTQIQTARVEEVRAGAMEMYRATKTRYLGEVNAMPWKDVQHAQFALGIVAGKVLPKDKAGANLTMPVASGGKIIQLAIIAPAAIPLEPGDVPIEVDAEVVDGE